MVKKSNKSLSISRIKNILGLDKEKKSKLEKENKKELKFKKTKKVKRKNNIKDKKNIKSYKMYALSNPLCDTCLNVKVDKNNIGTLKSLNAETWKESQIHIPLLGDSNNKECQQVYINMGKEYSGRLVYYFAANSYNSKVINKYPHVYKNSTNNGLIVLDNKGCGIAKVDCPAVYLDLSPKTIIKKSNKLQAYMNHIHYVVSDNKMTKWSDKLYTQNVLCKINKSEYEMLSKLNVRVVLNALESKYNIPGTDGNILYKEAEKMKNVELKKIVYNISKNKSPIHKKILKHCNVVNVPLIVYCYDHKCNAARQLALSLYKAGFYNIVYYSEGFMGYYGRK